MKKVLLFIVGFLVLVIAGIEIALTFYKEDIKALIDKQVANSVNAKVYYDFDQLSLSIIRDFPSLSVKVGDFGVVGNTPFNGDTLAHINELAVSVNVWSAIAGDEIKVDGLYIDRPHLLIKVLEDGTANYDITLDTEEEEVADTTSTSDVKISVDTWEITDGTLIYDDKSLATFVDIKGLYHKGSGDFTLEVFDVLSNTTAEGMTVEYEGITYFNKTKVDADINMNLDISDVYTFTFLENNVKLNDFVVGFDGWFKMPDDAYEMDISFESKESDFVSLLSLVPADFMQGYESLETSGNIAFNGFVKGTYTEEQLPGFKVDLKVNDGMFKYPDLPTAVSNISVDMLVDNSGADLENMLIDIREMHLDFGNNPVDGKIRIAGLTDYDIAANVNASLNLEELSTMFPMAGLNMKGLFEMKLDANGVYSESKGSIPKTDAMLTLTDGMLAYAEYPVPMENINMDASIVNDNGILNDTKVNVDKFDMLVDGEPFHADGHIANLDNATYDFTMKGGLDFTLIDKIYPLEDMHLTGKMYADIATKGTMSDIEAERYGNLPTSGTVKLENLEFTSVDLPQGLTIAEASAEFTPKEIILNQYEGTVGKSDMQLTGKISNYMAYVFGENQLLRGNMSMYSKKFDTNEWMTEAEAAVEDTVITEEEVVAIPKDIDFIFDAKLDKVLYDNLAMNNMTGSIIMRNGIMDMRNLKFELLGGSFVTNGSYNTEDPTDPKFSFDLDISKLSFKKSYENFNTVQTLAPLAQNINGDFSTKFKISGDLGNDLLPVMETLSGSGLVKIKDAALEEVKILNEISSLTSLSALKNPALKDIAFDASIEDGKMKIKPFDFTLAGIASTLEGSTSLAGQIDYNLKMDVPADKLGSSLGAQYASLTGSNTIKVPFNISGSYNSPKVGMGKGEGELKEQLAAKAKEELKEETKVVADSAKSALKEGLTDILTNKNDTTNNKENIKETAKEVKDAAKDALKELNPFGKKKKKDDGSN